MGNGPHFEEVSKGASAPQLESEKVDSFQDKALYELAQGPPVRVQADYERAAEENWIKFQERRWKIT